MFRKDYIYMDYLRDEVVMSEEEKKVFNDLKVSIFAKLLFDDINSKIPNVLDFDYLLIILRLKSNFIKPTRGIDIGTKTEIQKLVLKLSEEEGMTVMFISLGIYIKKNIYLLLFRMQL